MRAKLVGWAIGFVASWAMAGAMLLSTCRAHPGAPPAPVPPRDPAKVSDVELELILNKVREGDLRALANEMEAARRAWEEARRMGEGLWPIHEGLGDSFARAKLYDEAIREYQVAEPLVPAKHAAMKAGVMAKRGDALAAAGRPLEAIDAWLETRQPGAVAARILEQAPRDPDGAARKVARWAEIHDPRAWLLLATLLAKLERKPEAAEALAKYAIAVAPWDEAINRRAIEGLREGKKFDQAIEVCRAWVRSTPQALEVYRTMGDLHRQAGREKEALVAYSSIVDVRPGDAGAHRMLGEILAGINRPDDAIAQYEAARKARPEDQVTYSTLISLYDSKGDAARSEEVMLEASKRFGQNAEFRSKLAAAYQERIAKLKAEGKADEARALRRKLAELNVLEAGLYDLKIVMTWDARSDVDLDVYEPSGERVEHSHPRSKAGGVYTVDNTAAFGPETYTLPKAPPGTYRVGAHLHGETRSLVKIVVLLFEDTPREERREETFVLEKAGEQKFITDIVIPK
jgi:tetratricopeptide (TPR) repeat protein